MSKRNNSYRQKVPMEFLPLIDSANDLKLYLVQEIGPTSFIFKDDFDNKFKVSIGPTISCSCSKSNDHCIHTFYVMFKIFKRSKNDPLVWQNAYIDNEISDLIKSRFEIRAIPNNKKKFLMKHSLEKTSTSKPENCKKKFSRMVLDQESLCPICQEILNPNDQALTFCKKKCGNNFHIKCIKIWVQHKLSTKDQITCPMCRVDWGNGILEEMVREEDNFQHRFIIHEGKTCENCNMKNIKGNIYHCVYCKNYDLCEGCYKTYQHLIHNKFLMKTKSDGQWIPAFGREKQYILDKKNNLYSFCKNLTNYEISKPQDLNNELSNQNSITEIFFSKDNNVSSLNDFIVDCIPNLENSLNEYGKSAHNNLQIIGVEILAIKTTCLICNENSPKMKKLFCGHLIDKNCLKKLLNSSKCSCPIDGLNFLEGLEILNRNEITKNDVDHILSEKTKKIAMKRSKTIENNKLSLKTIFPVNKLEINTTKYQMEENKFNIISNVSSEKIITEIRHQALENRSNQNKFRIISTNKNMINSQKNGQKTSENLNKKIASLDQLQLIGNKCFLKNKSEF